MMLVNNQQMGIDMYYCKYLLIVNLIIVNHLKEHLIVPENSAKI